MSVRLLLFSFSLSLSHTHTRCFTSSKVDRVNQRLREHLIDQNVSINFASKHISHTLAFLSIMCDAAENSGVDATLAPELPPAFKLLAYFEDKRCISPEHECALKMAIWNLSLGIASKSSSGANLSQVMAIIGLQLKIWTSIDIAKPVELTLEIATPPTSEYYSDFTVVNMLAGEKVWCTKTMPAHQVESVVLSVAAGSRVTSFEVASRWSKSDRQVCVEEVGADGSSVGATLVAWNHFGTCSGFGLMPSNHTSDTIVVETTATRFKVSIRHGREYETFASLTIFRAMGIAP